MDNMIFSMRKWKLVGKRHANFQKNLVPQPYVTELYYNFDW